MIRPTLGLFMVIGRACPSTHPPAFSKVRHFFRAVGWSGRQATWREGGREEEKKERRRRRDPQCHPGRDEATTR